MVAVPRLTPRATMPSAVNAASESFAQAAVIGDVHGCGVELRELLADIDRARGRVPVVFVGDLFTKGPLPHVVVREILARREEGQTIRLVCGNHDQRMLLAIVQVEAGVDVDHLPRTERMTWQILHKKRLLAEATELLVEANETIEITSSLPPRGFSVIHGGIEPKLGLARTPDQVKIHLKAEGDEPHWWERYRGDDGLLIVGHKPLLQPLILRSKSNEPMVVNVDTGCAYGNMLTAYLPCEDRMMSVPSRQPRGEQYRALRVADANGSTRRAQRERVSG